MDSPSLNTLHLDPLPSCLGAVHDTNTLLKTIIVQECSWTSLLANKKINLNCNHSKMH